MIRTARRSSASLPALLSLSLAGLVLFAAACAEEPPPEAPPGGCHGLEPLRLSATPSRVRTGERVRLHASGGSERYGFGAEPDGSGGELFGAAFVAGRTPGHDRIFAEDRLCGGRVVIEIEVVAPFAVAPVRATVKPGTAFQIEVGGTLGAPAFAMVDARSGGTVNAAGGYTAGAADGLDLVEVSDPATGEQVWLQVHVKSAARFRASPARLAVPAGGSVALSTLDGTDQVTWSRKSGPGQIVEGRFVAGPEDTGAAELSARDRITGEEVTAQVRILDELLRPSAAHGRLGDEAAMVSADFDGDGIADLAVGIPDSDLAFPQGGVVLVYRGSGAGLSAAPAWTLTGEDENALFGSALAAADLDGDGAAELIVGAPGASLTVQGSGAVYLYKVGSKGLVPLRAPLTSTGKGQFGAALVAADFDGDGQPDLAVGSPQGDVGGGTRRGVVDVFLTRGGALPDLGDIRLSGMDLDAAGKVVSTANVAAGKALAAADFNGDGRMDLAVLGQVGNSLLDGEPRARTQVAVQVYLSRGGARPWGDTPDAYVLPINAADSTEGKWKLGVVPAVAGRQPMLLVLADQTDSPDLSAKGGNKAAVNAGGALLFDLGQLKPEAVPPAVPPQLGRVHAFARIYGDAANGRAGRSFAFMEVDDAPGPELILGAPYSPAPVGTATVSQAGRLLAFPLSSLNRGDEVNKTLEVLRGDQAHQTLGAGLATWALPGGTTLAAVSGRMSTVHGNFTGQVELFRPQTTGFGSWTRSSAPVPARAAVEQFGADVAVTVNGSSRWAAIGAPGTHGPGVNKDGNDRGAGAVLLFDAARPREPKVAAEGAVTPILRGGRALGGAVAFTDFNGDGRPDLVIGAPNLVQPGANVRAAEITPHYEAEIAGCIPEKNTTTGGLMVHLGQADGSFAPAVRLWAPAEIAGCTPAGTAACTRSALGRQLAGGFDFNGDGRQDLLATRSNGVEVFLGQAGAAGGKLQMGCEPAFSSDPGFVTAAPVALGDLDGDGCDEIAWRYTHLSGTPARSGLAIMFGFDASGTRCGGRSGPAVVRISGDDESGLPMLGLGLAATRAGRFLGDNRDWLAVSALTWPVEGIARPAVALFDVARLAALRPASGSLVVPAFGGALEPKLLWIASPTPGFGSALAGGLKLADGRPGLLVAAPDAEQGAGAVYLYAGTNAAAGAGAAGAPVEPVLMAVGADNERSRFGESLSLLPGSEPLLVIGAPRSYRTGTQNGTAFVLPLGF